MKRSLKLRRTIVALVALVGFSVLLAQHPDMQQPAPPSNSATSQSVDEAGRLAAAALDMLPVKGRAPKTDYARTQFGGGWARTAGCDMRNIILHRDLTDVQVNDVCQVMAGVLQDPYTGKTIQFLRGASTSQLVQIDHVVALSNAWQTGAQQLTRERRVELANDPLELLAVDGAANQQKSSSDAATWLPSNKAFRCQYVARQIAVKQKYDLWVTVAEKDAMQRVLAACPGQLLPKH